MHGRQKAGAPVQDATGRQAANIGQHDKRGQVLVQRAQSVRHPGTHARKPGADEAGVHHEHGRPVQRRLVLHRVNERQFVGMFTQSGEQLAHPATRLAVLLELPKAFAVIARVAGERLFAEFAVERLAVSLFQLGTIVKGVDLAHATGAEDLNHRFGTGRVMRLWLIGGARVRMGQGCQGHRAKAAAGHREKRPAGVSGHRTPWLEALVCH